MADSERVMMEKGDLPEVVSRENVLKNTFLYRMSEVVILVVVKYIG